MTPHAGITCYKGTTLYATMTRTHRAQAFYEVFPRRLDGVRERLKLGETESARDALLDARKALQAAAPDLSSHDIQMYEAAWSQVHRELTRPTHTFRFVRDDTSRKEQCETRLPSAPIPDPSFERHRIIHTPLGEGVVLHHLDACVIYIGEVHGSVLLESCTACLVVGSAQQCRFTQCSHMAVCVDTPTPLSLEKCHHIFVGCLADMQAHKERCAVSVQDFDDILGEGVNYNKLDASMRAQLQPAQTDPTLLDVLYSYAL